MKISFFQRLEALIGTGLKRFIGIITLANHSYNMDDYHEDTTTAAYKSYRVGQNNQAGKGTQMKLFVSKSTLIMCTTAVYLKFNHSENVIHTLLANTYKEWDHDIHSISYAWVASEGALYIECEGVLAQEGRIGH